MAVDGGTVRQCLLTYLLLLSLSKDAVPHKGCLFGVTKSKFNITPFSPKLPFWGPFSMVL